jgi:L-arabinonolactonase
MRTGQMLNCTAATCSRLGESPVWSVAEQALYWVDIGAGEPEAGQPPSWLHRFDPAEGSTRSWALPETVGSFALCEGGGALVAILSGLHHLDFASGKLTLRVKTPYDPALQRFNDGKCDRAGRFWVGQVRRSAIEPPPVGDLYCYDGRTLRAGGFIHGTSNSLAWSPDNRTLYFSDSVHSTVWAMDYDIERGTFDNRRPFVSTPQRTIFDGAAVDAEGGFWVALFRGGKVQRYLPDGRLDREIVLPVSNPTMMAFGGPDLRTLYITTASAFLTDGELAQQPLAGALFCCEPGVQGLPEPLFRAQA